MAQQVITPTVNAINDVAFAAQLDSDDAVLARLREPKFHDPLKGMIEADSMLDEMARGVALKLINSGFDLDHLLALSLVRINPKFTSWEVSLEAQWFISQLSPQIQTVIYDKIIPNELPPEAVERARKDLKALQRRHRRETEPIFASTAAGPGAAAAAATTVARKLGNSEPEDEEEGGEEGERNQAAKRKREQDSEDEDSFVLKSEEDDDINSDRGGRWLDSDDDRESETDVAPPNAKRPRFVRIANRKPVEPHEILKNSMPLIWLPDEQKHLDDRKLFPRFIVNSNRAKGEIENFRFFRVRNTDRRSNRSLFLDNGILESIGVGFYQQVECGIGNAMLIEGYANTAQRMLYRIHAYATISNGEVPLPPDDIIKKEIKVWKIGASGFSLNVSRCIYLPAILIDDGIARHLHSTRGSVKPEEFDTKDPYQYNYYAAETVLDPDNQYINVAVQLIEMDYAYTFHNWVRMSALSPPQPNLQTLMDNFMAMMRNSGYIHYEFSTNFIGVCLGILPGGQPGVRRFCLLQTPDLTAGPAEQQANGVPLNVGWFTFIPNTFTAPYLEWYDTMSLLSELYHSARIGKMRAPENVPRSLPIDRRTWSNASAVKLLSWICEGVRERFNRECGPESHLKAYRPEYLLLSLVPKFYHFANGPNGANVQTLFSDLSDRVQWVK